LEVIYLRDRKLRAERAQKREKAKQDPLMNRPALTDPSTESWPVHPRLIGIERRLRNERMRLLSNVKLDVLKTERTRRKKERIQRLRRNPRGLLTLTLSLIRRPRRTESS